MRSAGFKVLVRFQIVDDLNALLKAGLSLAFGLYRSCQ